MKTRYELRLSARETLNGHWGTMALATLVFMLISGVANMHGSLGRILNQVGDIFNLSDSWGLKLLATSSSLSTLGVAISIFVIFPLSFGFEQMFLRFERDRNTDIVSAIFWGFKEYWRSVAVSLLYVVYIFLWCLLFIVPGIVKAYAYSMSYYLALDHPEWDAERCIHESRMMMRGHKWQLFVLDLSFIGWRILCIFTLGIGTLWLQPYMNQTHVKFYNELVADQQPAEKVEA